MWIPITAGVIIGAWFMYVSLEVIKDWLDGPVDYDTLHKIRESEEFDRLYGPHD